jgi:hypothetical protein
MEKNKEAIVVLEEVAQYLKETAEGVDASTAYGEGRLIGYYEALSVIFSQCRVMGITGEDIGLAGFDPDTLIGLRKTA